MQKQIFTTIILLIFLIDLSLAHASTNSNTQKLLLETLRDSELEILLSNENNIAPTQSMCDLAQKVMLNKDTLLKNSQLVDSALRIISTASKLKKTCAASDIFKKTILPLLKDGDSLIAKIDDDYYLNASPQLINIELLDPAVNQRPDMREKLNNCKVEAKLYLDENDSPRFMAHRLNCNLSGIAVQVPIDTTSLSEGYLHCDKYRSIFLSSILPKYFQPCARYHIEKNHIVNFTIKKYDFDWIDYSDSTNTSTHFAKESLI